MSRSISDLVAAFAGEFSRRLAQHGLADPNLTAAQMVSLLTLLSAVLTRETASSLALGHQTPAGKKNTPRYEELLRPLLPQVEAGLAPLFDGDVGRVLVGSGAYVLNWERWWEPTPTPFVRDEAAKPYYLPSFDARRGVPPPPRS